MTKPFNIRTANLRAINSLTKYPSIPTYHALDPSNGRLTAETVAFTGKVIGTEKVDGTNARIVLCPDGTYLLGSREHLLYAKKDLIGDPAQGIVAALRDVAEEIADTMSVFADELRVIYVELYGSKIGAAAKNYTRKPDTFGWRLFDVARVPGLVEAMTWTSERIAAWRDNSGQHYSSEIDLQEWSRRTGLVLAPRLFALDAEDIPTGLPEMREWMASWLPSTLVGLDQSLVAPGEGVVLRTEDRAVIAKARFQDYDRTLHVKANR